MDLYKTVRNTVLGGLVAVTASCAGTCNRIEADGSIVGSVSAPYVVIKQSGGRITDVYKLDEAYIQSETGSDGWLFLDKEGHPVHIGGDMKSIRFKSTSDSLWEQYHDYHMEFESQTYPELYGKPPEKKVNDISTDLLQDAQDLLRWRGQ